MKRYQITIELPDDFESLEQLEQLVDTEGQKVKQYLFQTLLSAIGEREKNANSEVRCPHCEKKSRQPGKSTQISQNPLW